MFLNSAEADTTPVGTYVDDSIKVIDIPDLEKGRNELRIELGYDQKNYVENVYILGDFGVSVNGNIEKVS